MTFEITRSKNLVSRSLQPRTASILCGALLWAPFANVAFAVEAKVVLDQILGEAIPQLQNVMASVSQGCSGGSSGLPQLAGVKSRNPATWLSMHSAPQERLWQQARHRMLCNRSTLV